MLSMKTAWGENPALSYRNMRAIIGYVGLTLPVVLLLAGASDGRVESSLSAYYYGRPAAVARDTPASLRRHRTCDTTPAGWLALVRKSAKELLR